jgi:hypothetical protein
MTASSRQMTSSALRRPSLVVSVRDPAAASRSRSASPFDK